MEWMQLVTIILTFLGTFLWSRSESKADHRYILSLIDEIRSEMKDFHGKLCAIEEKYRKKD